MGGGLKPPPYFFPMSVLHKSAFESFVFPDLRQFFQTFYIPM